MRKAPALLPPASALRPPPLPAKAGASPVGARARSGDAHLFRRFSTNIRWPERTLSFGVRWGLVPQEDQPMPDSDELVRDDAPITSSKTIKPDAALSAEAVTIARPARELYDFWRQVTNLAGFM